MDTAITAAESIETVNAIAGLFAALDAAKPATVKPFKSERAARIAFGKAERAWEAARSARIQIEHAQRDPETKVQPTEAERARLDALRLGYEGIAGVDLQTSPAFNAYCDLWSEINARPVAEAEAIEEAARLQMVAVYRQAEAQKIWIHSYHLNHNPTRDLIANNCD